MRMLTLLALLLTIDASPQLVGASDQPAHLVQVGTHKMSLNCGGKETDPTVILEAGTGDSSEVWNTVQERVEKFARVCSYDRLGRAAERCRAAQIQTPEMRPGALDE
jgi:hypothetical protein